MIHKLTGSFELGLALCKDVHSKFDNPHIIAFLPKVPVIAQRIGDHVSRVAHFCNTDWHPSIVQAFYLVLYLKIPNVQEAVGSGSHNPLFASGIEAYGVDGVQIGHSLHLLLIALEGDPALLNKYIITTA